MLPTIPTLGKYSSALGIDPLLITNGETNIVIDPGLGWGLDYNSRFRDTSNVITNLNIFGLRPEDIHHVVLSHLHFDHAAGCTFVDQHIKTCAVFPNAAYHVHNLEWEHALAQTERDVKKMKGAGYRLDELYKLAAEDRFAFYEDELFELIPGITLMKTGGHTPGHVVVKIEDSGKAGYYMGDLVPTEYHLNHYSMKRVDLDPIQSKKAKTILLRQALKEKAVMFFYHSLYKKSGRISLDKKKRYVLKDI